MTEQERIKKQTSERSESTTETNALTPDAAKNEQLKADLDNLLDEIDEVLEDNAEEFVRNYVQKGGE